MLLTVEYQSARRKTSLSATFSTTDLTWYVQASNAGPCSEILETGLLKLKKVKVLFYPMLTDFRKSLAFGRSPVSSFVLL